MARVAIWLVGKASVRASIAIGRARPGDATMPKDSGGIEIASEIA